MQEQLYYLQGSTDHETHDTICCCGMPSALPHEAVAATIYKLDLPGLQAMHDFYAGYDDVTFDDWMQSQESQGTYYGASEEAAIEEALMQARKQGMILINYPDPQTATAAPDVDMLLSRTAGFILQGQAKSYTLADATALNTIKNRIRDVTRLLDATQKVYPQTLEAAQVKHEISVLLSELAIHGLLPKSAKHPLETEQLHKGKTMFPQNPKPYHIELRQDTGRQEILQEDDIYADCNDATAVDLLLKWKQAYIHICKPEVALIAVCTHNWTKETLYQDVPKSN